MGSQNPRVKRMAGDIAVVVGHGKQQHSVAMSFDDAVKLQSSLGRCLAEGDEIDRRVVMLARIFTKMWDDRRDVICRLRDWPKRDCDHRSKPEPDVGHEGFEGCYGSGFTPLSGMDIEWCASCLAYEAANPREELQAKRQLITKRLRDARSRLFRACRRGL